MSLRLVAVYGAILLLSACASNNGPRQTWVLMVPPPSTGPVFGFDMQAPLADWEPSSDSGFDTVDDCRKYQGSIVANENTQGGWERNADEQDYGTNIGRLGSGICVNLTDPRLHGRHNSTF